MQINWLVTFERDQGVELGPIPRNSMSQWLEHAGLEAETTRCHVVRQLTTRPCYHVMNFSFFINWKLVITRVFHARGSTLSGVGRGFRRHHLSHEHYRQDYIGFKI